MNYVCQHKPVAMSFCLDQPGIQSVVQVSCLSIFASMGCENKFNFRRFGVNWENDIK